MYQLPPAGVPTGRLGVEGLVCLQVTEFSTKADLIEAVLASCHIPFVLDGASPALKFR